MIDFLLLVIETQTLLYFLIYYQHSANTHLQIYLKKFEYCEQAIFFL